VTDNNVTFQFYIYTDTEDNLTIIDRDIIEATDVYYTMELFHLHCPAISRR